MIRSSRSCSIRKDLQQKLQQKKQQNLQQMLQKQKENKKMTNFIGIVSRVNGWDFERALYGDFSADAAAALYDYYTELSEAIGEPIELDPIEIRCDWHEYDDDAGFISDMALDDIDGILEDVNDFQEYGDLYGYHAYRLSNGRLLVRQG